MNDQADFEGESTGEVFEPPECPMCTGPAKELSAKGDTIQLRCRKCGFTYQHEEER